MVFYDPARYENNHGVFLYALSTCVHCKNAKKLLQDLGVQYDHVDVDKLEQDSMNEALEEMSQYNPAETFPTIIIGGKVIVGDRDDDIRQAVAKLNASK